MAVSAYFTSKQICLLYKQADTAFWLCRAVKADYGASLLIAFLAVQLVWPVGEQRAGDGGGGGNRGVEVLYTYWDHICHLSQWQVRPFDTGPINPLTAGAAYIRVFISTLSTKF